MEKEDVDLIISYFLQADADFLQDMGVDSKKLPHRETWQKLLFEDLARPIRRKNFFYLIWELDGSPIGHSNINNITFGNEAHMHLHLWEPGKRRCGHGSSFIRESISVYFEKFDLQNLFCEPYALNPAPNKTLAEIGFELIKQYDTVPGWINFFQTVNQWILSRENWRSLNNGA